MTYAPKTLVELGAYWKAQGGVMLGIVGDTGHTKGYHLGRDRIFDGPGPGIGDQDYSVQHPRDRAGLSNGAAAIDLGRLDGSLEALYGFSRALVRDLQRGVPGSRDVREVIYSPDGDRVQRYSGLDGDIHTGPGNGDQTHLTHTHISYFRDSEGRSKIGPFAGILEADMAAIVWAPLKGGDGVVVLKPERGLVDLVTGRRYVPAETTKNAVCRINATDVGTGYLVRDLGHGCLALDDAVLTFTPTPVAGLHRFVITVDGVEPLTVTRDAEPIE